MYPRPKYLLIVFALAGDSTITSDLAIGFFYYIPGRSADAAFKLFTPSNHRPGSHDVPGAPNHPNPGLAGELQQDFHELLTR